MNEENALSLMEHRIRNIKHKMGRLKESKDVARLLRLRKELDQVQDDINALKGAIRSSPVFRKSYAYEMFCERLLMAVTT